MPKLRPVAAITILMPLVAGSTAHATRPCLPLLIPLAPLAAQAALRSLRALTLARAVLDFEAPHKAPSRLLTHRDLDDVVRDWIGGRATFYVGGNLAHGDTSGVKTFGLKLFF